MKSNLFSCPQYYIPNVPGAHPGCVLDLFNQGSLLGVYLSSQMGRRTSAEGCMGCQASEME